MYNTHEEVDVTGLQRKLTSSAGQCLPELRATTQKRSQNSIVAAESGVSCQNAQEPYLLWRQDVGDRKGLILYDLHETPQILSLDACPWFEKRAHSTPHPISFTQGLEAMIRATPNAAN